MQRKAYALVGAAAAIAAAVGPLLGGFITTFLSWRIAFLGEAVIIAIVLSGIKLVHDVPYTGSRGVDVVGAILSALGMGGVVLGILVWEDGGEAVGALIVLGLAALGALVWWLKRRKRQGKPALLDIGLFSSKYFRLGISGQTLQQIALGGMMIALPIYLQMVLEYNALEAGLSLAPLSLTMFAVALLAGRKAGNRSPSRIILVGFGLLVAGLVVLIPIVPRADSGWAMALPLAVGGAGLGLLVSQLNNYTLAPIEEERVSEAAGVNSAGGSFGLAFGLAFAGAIMLASLSLVFTDQAESSDVLSPAQQEQVADGLEHDAEVMTNTELGELLEGQPADVQEEILDINTDARPIALQIALLIPLGAALLGLLTAFRMTRLPDPKPSAAAESVLGRLSSAAHLQHDVERRLDHQRAVIGERLVGLPRRRDRVTQVVERVEEANQVVARARIRTGVRTPEVDPVGDALGVRLLAVRCSRFDCHHDLRFQVSNRPDHDGCHGPRAEG
jgi:MFS family permease